MRGIDYKCGDCGLVRERFYALSKDAPDFVIINHHVPHEDDVANCPSNRLARAYSPVAIGAVSGAGGSPARTRRKESGEMAADLTVVVAAIVLAVFLEIWVWG